MAPPPQRAQVSYIVPDLCHLDEHPADLIVMSAFADEQPFEGLAAVVDWRLGAAMSHWRQRGFSTGRVGERILFPCAHRLTTPRLMLLGLGQRAAFVPERAIDIAGEAAQAAVALGAGHVITTLFGLEHLATPLERTAARVVGRLVETPGITRITLAIPGTIEQLVREALAFHWRQR